MQYAQYAVSICRLSFSMGPAGDHCCVQTVAECPGGERVASTMLGWELPEWLGQIPPELVQILITSSTLEASPRIVKILLIYVYEVHI